MMERKAVALGACLSDLMPGVLVLTFVIVGNAGSAKAGEPRVRMVSGAELHEVLPPDAIPSIDTPQFVSGEEARGFMRDDEPVLGVTDGRSAKCYSTWLLEHHEIVNDSLGATPIVTSW